MHSFPVQRQAEVDWVCGRVRRRIKDARIRTPFCVTSIFCICICISANVAAESQHGSKPPPPPPRKLEQRERTPLRSLRATVPDLHTTTLQTPHCKLERAVTSAEGVQRHVPTERRCTATVVKNTRAGHASRPAPPGLRATSTSGMRSRRRKFPTNVQFVPQESSRLSRTV